MTPYKNAGNDVQKLRYNKVHSRTRQKIEHSFGLLTSRWRFLWKHVYMLNLLRISKTLYVCCVLHNICIDDNDGLDLNDPRGYQTFVDRNQMEEEADVVLNNLPEESDFTLPSAAGLRDLRSDAEEIRRQIMSNLN